MASGLRALSSTDRGNRPSHPGEMPQRCIGSKRMRRSEPEIRTEPSAAFSQLAHGDAECDQDAAASAWMQQAEESDIPGLSWKRRVPPQHNCCRHSCDGQHHRMAKRQMVAAQKKSQMILIQQWTWCGASLTAWKWCSWMAT